MAIEPCAPQVCVPHTDSYGRPYEVCAPRPGRPPSISPVASLGWTAGANSVKTLRGDVILTIPAPVGVVGAAVVGLKNSRGAVTLPEAVAHGWIFEHSPTGTLMAAAWEFGVRVSASRPVHSAIAYVVARRRSRVLYIAGGEIVAERRALITGDVLVNACLYAPGDTLP